MAERLRGNLRAAFQRGSSAVTDLGPGADQGAKSQRAAASVIAVNAAQHALNDLHAIADGAVVSGSLHTSAAHMFSRLRHVCAVRSA